MREKVWRSVSNINCRRGTKLLFTFVLISDSELFYAESQTIKGQRGVSGGECKRAVLVVR